MWVLYGCPGKSSSSVRQLESGYWFQLEPGTNFQLHYRNYLLDRIQFCRKDSYSHCPSLPNYSVEEYVAKLHVNPWHSHWKGVINHDRLHWDKEGGKNANMFSKPDPKIMLLDLGSVRLKQIKYLINVKNSNTVSENFMNSLRRVYCNFALCNKYFLLNAFIHPNVV